MEPDSHSNINRLTKDLEYIVLNIGSSWNSLTGKKVFLTGGTGFFGKWLLESFAWANKTLNLNSEIHVLSRNPESFKNEYPLLNEARQIYFHKGDVRSFKFPAGRFDFIIHAATESSAQLNEQDPLLMVDTVVSGTRRVLDFAVHCRAKKFLLTSSGAVYGKQPPNISHVLEEYLGAPDLSEPMSAYGEAKRLAELLCSIYLKQFKLDVMIARCFAFVGPHLPLGIHFAIGNFILDVLERRNIQISGDGTSLRSYLYAADLAVCLWKILFCGKPGRAYNVGSDQEISIQDLAEKVGSVSDWDPKITMAKTPARDQSPERYVPDIERIKTELGLTHRIELSEGIRRTIQFYQCKNGG